MPPHRHRALRTRRYAPQIDRVTPGGSDIACAVYSQGRGNRDSGTDFLLRRSGASWMVAAMSSRSTTRMGSCVSFSARRPWTPDEQRREIKSRLRESPDAERPAGQSAGRSDGSTVARYLFRTRRAATWQLVRDTSGILHRRRRQGPALQARCQRRCKPSSPPRTAGARPSSAALTRRR